jgi:hypothetical protein
MCGPTKKRIKRKKKSEKRKREKIIEQEHCFIKLWGGYFPIRQLVPLHFCFKKKQDQNQEPGSGSIRNTYGTHSKRKNDLTVP